MPSLLPLPRLLSRCLLLGAAALLTPRAGLAADSAVLAVGIGAQRMPAWPGAGNDREDPVPYVDIELPGVGSFSTLDGLEVELLHGSDLRGGLYGSYQWGRERSDLGALSGRIPSLSPRPTLGGYLEWTLSSTLDVGTDLSHDIDGAGAYLDLYADKDLPPIGVLQHAVSLRWQLMNGAAMNRFFGFAPGPAAALGIRPWHPAGGSEMASLEYDLFLPTSPHTGVALALIYGHLLGHAEGSPLVSSFGAATQVSESLAFIYHP